MHDIVIIGAGPIGLACGIAARRAGLSALLIEKGALVNSFVHYPTDLEFFSTPELLEIGGIPFTTRNYKPVRAEALEYYRHVAELEQLEIRLYEEVVGLDGEGEAFTVRTTKGSYRCRKVIIATGFFDVPNRMDVPGEDLPKVLHYYKEPYPFAHQKVAVIGARNSAAKVALDCYRHGCEVTLIVRSPEISEKVKYWIRPDLENRIKEGSIRALFDTTVERITERAIHVCTPEGKRILENDWVLAMTGYRPNFGLLETLGVEFEDDAFQTPVHDPETMETNRAGLYLAGVVCGGLNTSVWFVENSRVHADRIVADILGGTPESYTSVLEAALSTPASQ